MTESLAEAKDRVTAPAETWRGVKGLLLLTLSGLLLFASIMFAATDIHTVFGWNTTQSWEVAGILAGISIPTLVTGVITVLPHVDQTIKSFAVIGIAGTIIGTVVFTIVFPHQWQGDPTDLTVIPLTIYAIGALVSVSSIFTAVSNFKARNSAGGTVTIEVHENNEIRHVEVKEADLQSSSLSAMGLIGSQPDGNVETQTRRDTSND